MSFDIESGTKNIRNDMIQKRGGSQFNNPFTGESFIGNPIFIEPKGFNATAALADKKISRTQSQVQELVSKDPTNPLALLVTLLGKQKEFRIEDNLKELRGEATQQAKAEKAIKLREKKLDKISKDIEVRFNKKAKEALAVVTQDSGLSVDETLLQPNIMELVTKAADDIPDISPLEHARLVEKFTSISQLVQSLIYNTKKDGNRSIIENSLAILKLDIQRAQQRGSRIKSIDLDKKLNDIEIMIKDSVDQVGAPQVKSPTDQLSSDKNVLRPNGRHPVQPNSVDDQQVSPQPLKGLDGRVRTGGNVLARQANKDIDDSTSVISKGLEDIGRSDAQDIGGFLFSLKNSKVSKADTLLGQFSNWAVGFLKDDKRDFDIRSIQIGVNTPNRRVFYNNNNDTWVLPREDGTFVIGNNSGIISTSDSRDKALELSVNFNVSRVTDSVGTPPTSNLPDSSNIGNGSTSSFSVLPQSLKDVTVDTPLTTIDDDAFGFIGSGNATSGNATSGKEIEERRGIFDGRIKSGSPVDFVMSLKRDIDKGISDTPNVFKESMRLLRKTFPSFTQLLFDSSAIKLDTSTPREKSERLQKSAKQDRLRIKRDTAKSSTGGSQPKKANAPSSAVLIDNTAIINDKFGDKGDFGNVLAMVESSGNPKAVGLKQKNGKILHDKDGNTIKQSFGLMQFTINTARGTEIGKLIFKDKTDDQVIKMLKDRSISISLAKEYTDSLRKTLTNNRFTVGFSPRDIDILTGLAYNWGIGRVKKGLRRIKPNSLDEFIDELNFDPKSQQARQLREFKKRLK